MRKTVLIYGILGGLLIAALKVIEYRFLVLEHSLEIYGGIVALLFSMLGIWLGLRLTQTRETVVVREVPVRVTGPFERNQARAPDYMAKMQAHMVEEARADGESEEALARKRVEMEKFAEMYKNPAINAAITFVEPLPVALIVVLVSAGVLSRRRVMAGENGPAAARRL